MHLALQCSLARAFSVHLISILAHFVHCSNDLGSTRHHGMIQISMNHGGPGHHMHELHVLLLSIAVVHLLSDPIIRLHMSPAPRAALGRCFSPRGVSAFSSRLRSMVPSLCETASTCEQMLWCRKPLRCLQDQAGGGQGAHLLARRRRGGGAGFMGAHSSASPVHLLCILV